MAQKYPQIQQGKFWKGILGASGSLERSPDPLLHNHTWCLWGTVPGCEIFLFSSSLAFSIPEIATACFCFFPAFPFMSTQYENSCSSLNWSSLKITYCKKYSICYFCVCVFLKSYLYWNNTRGIMYTCFHCISVNWNRSNSMLWKVSM